MYRQLCSIAVYPKKGTKNGAGEGNRTLATSLEGWGSTIELHPPKDGLSIRPLRKSGAVDEIRTRDIHLGKVALYH